MISSIDARKQLPASLHGLLDLVVQDHIKNERLQGVMIKPDKTNMDGFVIVDTDSSRELLQIEISAISGILTRPQEPFPYPVDFLTQDLLETIFKAREAKKERASRPRTPKPAEPKNKEEPSASASSDTPAEKADPQANAGTAQADAATVQTSKQPRIQDDQLSA